MSDRSAPASYLEAMRPRTATLVAALTVALPALATPSLQGCSSDDSRSGATTADAAPDVTTRPDATMAGDGGEETSPSDGGSGGEVTDATPAKPLIPSGPIVVANAADASLAGLWITSDAGDCVVITGSSHVAILGSEIGPCAGNGIKVTGGDDLTIADSFIHPEHPAAGCCDTGDGIFVDGTSHVLVQGNVIAYGEANIEMHAVTHVNVTGNHLVNPQNAGSRGQNLQVWGQSSDVNVIGNYALSSADPKYTYPPKQEDSINFGFTDGLVAQGNYVVGGQSPSGCGIIADEAANGAQFLDNVILDTGQCGIAIADGTNAKVDGNKILNRNPVAGGGNTGLVVWKQYTEACGPVVVTNNVSSELKPDMTTESGYWNGGGCEPVTFTGNILDANARALLLPVDTKLPPPPIPPSPLRCLAAAPWVNHTGFAPCGGI